jgi:outer membrane protein assembly factor BamB/tetratricopeptide (TPR) repeat protein
MMTVVVWLPDWRTCQETQAMIDSSRSLGWWLGLSAGLALGSAVLAQVVIEQPVQIGPGGMPLPPGKEGKTDGTKTSQFSAVKLIENSQYRQYINAARAAIKDEAWNDAVTALQKILDTQEDSYVQVREKDNQGREVLRWTSVKFEAQNLLGSMPEDGLEFYEQRYGGRAGAALKEAKETGDRDKLAEVAQRWLHTRAGAEANELLATMLLDRGQYFLAALRFERAIKKAGDPKKVPDLTLFKAALAFRRSGESKNATETWQKLEERLSDTDGLKIGDQTIALARLRTIFHDEKQPLPEGMYDWPMMRGNPSNTAQANGSPPLLDLPLWTRALLMDNDPNIGESRYHEKESVPKQKIDELFKEAGNSIGIPGFFPISAGGKLVFRSYGELRCIALTADGSDVKPGDTLWRSGHMEGSLNQIYYQPDLREIVNPWFESYKKFPGLPGFGNLLFENSMIGVISSDHQNVYAIDDLAIPSPDNMLQANPFMGLPQVNVPAKIRPYLMQNCLRAFNLQEGRERWYLGSFKDTDPKDEFTDSHFLGAPISIGGKLYVLNEKNQGAQGDAELRLVCIDPNKVEKGRPAIVAPIQVLGNIEQRNRVTHAISRRISGVQLAYGEGILVCPTNAGEVLGVDLMSRSLAWAYPYRERNPEERNHGNPGGIGFGGRQPFNPGMSMLASTVTLSKWRPTPPAVADGKIVFTAPDADSVHCINLRDGTPRWKVGRLDGDLFFAGVFNKKVLLVGKNHIRALNLDDGRPAWMISTGDVPSGQGVASHGVYYQPLKKGEIVAVDIERGAVKAHNRAKAANFSPGNLIFSDGAVITLTPYKVEAYPQLVARLEVADAAVKNDPNNPEKLIARGEIFLADGQVQKAVNDLQLALEQKLPAPLETRAKNRLYDALSDLLQADFNAASTKYLDEYRALCQLGETSTEKQMRQAKYFRIVGNGREAQGNLIEAFQMYKEFGTLPIHRETGGVASLDDPSHKVPVDVWLRGRVASMFARATPEQRAPLEAKIAEEWKTVEAKRDIDAIRTFVGMFDVAFAVGREARLKLAEAILEKNDPSNFLEAELNLYQLRGREFGNQPDSGGKALASLAHLEEKRGSAQSMQAASSYYRQLAREFPKDVVRQGKTGTDLFNDLAADKRLLPYLEDSSSFWSQAPIASRELGGVGISGMVAQNQVQINVLHPESEPSPFFKRHRLSLETSNLGQPPKLTLTDLSTGKQRWGPLTLGGMPMNIQITHLYMANQVNQNLNGVSNANARFRFYQSVGHVVVVQVGVMAYCVDADKGRILWQQALIDPTSQNFNFGASLMVGNDGNLDLVIHNQFGQQQRKSVGQVGAVQPNYVAIVSHDGLKVIDPLRGNVLWKKIDVQADSHVFGDDQHIFVVEINEAGAIAGTRVLRASDGESVQAPNFIPEYTNRIRIAGRCLLTQAPAANGRALRLYDALTGKNVWSKSLDAQAVVAVTDDPNLCGWVDSGTGKMTAIDAATGAELLTANLVQGRVGLEDCRNLREPLILADSERIYLALNQPADNARVGGGVVSGNFHNGIRSRLVNGYVMAFHRHDGQAKIGKKTVEVKKGDLAWHSVMPLENQMVVTEQFEQLPILLFSSRYNRVQAGNAWIASTQAIHKQTGRLVYESGSRPALNSYLAHFVNLQSDPRQGTINLIGHSYSIQFYVDDGRKVEPPAGLDVTSHLGPGNSSDYAVQPGVAGPGVVAPGAVIIRQRAVPIQVAPVAPIQRE